MIRDNKKIFSTTEFGLSCALIALGFELNELEKSNPRRAKFCFSDTTEIKKAVNLYWQDKLFINARSYFDAIRKVKSLLRNE